ncbi:MAG: helix-turn-helix domain-containing protein [Angustibacter sp.]
MDQNLDAVGQRIRSAMPAGLSQRGLADLVDMTPDALSRALNGQRGFSSAELARIAEQLGADLAWLITGRPDPLRVDVAARHSWDPARRQRVLPGAHDGEPTLAQVISSYRAAFPAGPPDSQPLPAEPVKLRALLGADFSREFPRRIERLGVDVLQLPGLSTDYSLRIGGRGVIVLCTTQNWFRANWSLAHELGHLALGHHDSDDTVATNEQPADAFAAELLLPAADVTAVDWPRLTQSQLAEYLWKMGVSTQALRVRLATLKITPSAAVAAGLHLSTTELLREWGPGEQPGDSAVHAHHIARRTIPSAQRRLPEDLLTALSQRVATGHAPPQDLAWALDIPLDDVDYPEPSETALRQSYQMSLTDRPNPTDWESLPTNSTR